MTSDWKSYWERQMALALARERGHGPRFEERLSSLIRQKYLKREIGTDDRHWVLLADSSTDRFVILQGIREGYWVYARNDKFKLVAAGNAASGDGYAVFWSGAKDLARVAHKIMMKKRNAANDSDIVQDCALRGLLICHVVGDEAKFFHPWSLGSATQSLELEMQMLSRVLQPPSVLAAAGASPSLLAQGPIDTAASSSSPSLAIIPVGMDSNPSEPTGYERQGMDMYSPSSSSGTRRLNLLPQEQELAAPPRHFVTRSSGGHGRNGAGILLLDDLIELLVRHWWREYDLRSQQRLELLADTDLEAGGQAHRVGSGAAAPVQQPSEVSQRLDAVMVQAFAAFLPACVTAYPLLKDAPDYIKFTIFGGLAFTTMGLFVGILTSSVARRGLVIRLVSFSAIAVLTFCVASQLSSRIYIALTALVGVVLNLIIMLLRF